MRILVVEDDPTDFAFVRKAFEGVATNVELFHCDRPAEALGLLEERGCRLVLLDLNLDGECGMDVLRTLRSAEAHKAVPVIVFSSSGSPRDISACYAAGANAYLEKPLTMERYRKFAQAFSSFWLDCATVPQD